MLINLVGNKDYFKEDPNGFELKIKGELAKKLLEGFSELPELQGYKLMGLTFQHSSEASDSIPDVQDSDLELLGGEAKVYHEIICGNKFEVSNSSFLQVNSEQMDKMYNYVHQMAKLDNNTVLLDICSGIGTIGLSVGQECKKIIGIEMVKSSCENAEKNAKANGKEGLYTVICGKVEDVIEEVV